MSAEQMLRGRDIVCFSHDWSGDPLSKTHLMRLLAVDNRVLWVNSIGYRTPQIGARKDLSRIQRKLQAAAQPVREVEPNLYVLNPLVIPAWGRASIRALNARFLAWQVKRAMNRLRFRQPMNWTFNPAAGILAGRLGESMVIYYCVDEYTAFAGVNSAALATVETDLLNRSDLVIVSAEKLLTAKVSPRAPTVLVRHGVDYEHFRKSLDVNTVIPEEIVNLPRPIIGYFGLIAEDWIDVPLLIHVAKSFPKGTLVFLGSVTTDVSQLMAEPNVRLLGRKPYSTLPNYCKGFDVGIIPFPISPVTLNANPLKAREYLAAGLPVVSTAIPEVEILGECGIAHSHEEFVVKLHAALESPGPQKARSERMATESWQSRLDEIRQHVAKQSDPRVSNGSRS